MKPTWERGNVRLYLGDCREVLPHVGKVDACITDPPYGIGFAAQPTKWQRLDGEVPKHWDNDTPELNGLESVAGIVVVWGGNYFPLPPSRGWLAWIKPDAPPSMGNVELAWTNVDRTARAIMHSISATNAERVSHPTQKPLRVIHWSMDVAGVRPDAVVCDPYMGSGTTGVAAVQTGRSFVGIEIDPTYFEIAVRRIDKAIDAGALFAPVPPAVREVGLFDAEGEKN